MISKQLLLQLFRSYFILFPNFLDSGGCGFGNSSHGMASNLTGVGITCRSCIFLPNSLLKPFGPLVSPIISLATLLNGNSSRWDIQMNQLHAFPAYSLYQAILETCHVSCNVCWYYINFQNINSFITYSQIPLYGILI